MGAPENPDELDFDDAFIDSLAEFDESLRSGIVAPDSRSASPQQASSRDCLTFLERAFPRYGSGAETPKPDRLGRFELIRILGQGGFGVVYLARDPRLGRQVALKVPRLQSLGSRHLHHRFLREARAAAALDHPHITPILETGEIGAVVYIASAYCDGADLAQWLQDHAPVVPQTAARILVPLADATHYSHTQGILHRDLKPSNVLLTRRNSSALRTDDELTFVPRLTDFGLARLVEENADETGSAMLGTPAYMAPEQAAGRNHEVSVTTDVYALGVILYEMLTGRPPFQGSGTMDVLDQIRTVDPVPPSRLVASIPRDLETICQKCLHKSVSGRYSSAEELRNDLQRFLAGDPIHAKPVTVWERAMKWSRRHPAALGTLFLSLLLVFVLFTGLVFHLSEMKTNLRVTDRLRSEALQRESTLRLQAYAGEVEAASGDLEAGMPALARKRLASFMPVDGAALDVRGPEWHYLWQQTQPAVPQMIFTGHQVPVFTVAAVDEGRCGVSGDAAGVIKVWDLETGEELQSLAAHDGEVRALRLSPDGRFLASAGSFRLIRVWNVADWTLAAEFDAHDGTVTCVDFDPTGRRLISSGRDGEIRCWEWRTAELLWRSRLDDVVQQVRFADGGATAYSAHGKTMLTKWDAAKGTAMWSESLDDFGEKLLALQVSPDSRFLLAGGYQGGIRCYDTREERHWALPLAERVPTSAWAPDGVSAAVGLSGGEVCLLSFSGESFRAVGVQRWLAHSETVNDLTFCRDGEMLLSAGADGTVKIWNRHDIPQQEASYLSDSRAGGSEFDCTTLSASSTELFTGGMMEGDGWARKWNIAARSDECELQLPGLPVHRLITNPRGNRLAAYCEDQAFMIWDNPVAGTVPLIIRTPGIRGIAFAPHGRTLAVAVCPDADVNSNSHSTVSLYDADSGELIRDVFSGRGRIAGLAWAPHGRSLVAGFLQSPLVIVNVDSGIVTTVAGTDEGTGQFSFSEDGRILAAGRAGITGEADWLRKTATYVYLIDADAGRLTSTFRHGLLGWQTAALAISPDGRLLAVGSSDGIHPLGHVLLWHVETGRTIMKLRPFQFLPRELAFLPGSHTLAVTAALPGRNLNHWTILWHLGPTQTAHPQPFSDF